MDPKVMELLVSKFEDRRQQIVEFLCDGAAKDYAAYKELCGEIRGLSAAQMEIQDLVRKLKELDDE